MPSHPISAAACSGALLLLFACAVARAADSFDDPLQTERPGIADGSKVVGPGRFQIETGIQRETQRDSRGDQRTLMIPTLLRFGIDKRWEARVESDGYTAERTFRAGSGVSRAEGYSPISIGAKYQFQFANENSGRPTLGVIGRVFLPSGSAGFGSQRLTADVRLAADHQLGPQWSVNSNVGMALYEDEAGNTMGAGIAAATLGYTIHKRLTPFLDVGLQSPAGQSGDLQAILDGGLLYLLSPNTQLDFAIGTGIAGDNLPDLYWTVGVSHRFSFF